MACFGDHVSSPDSPTVAPRSPLKRPLPPHSKSLHLHEDSEWSAPVPRALAKDMPCLPDRFIPSWSKTSKPVDPARHDVWLFDNTAFRLDNNPQEASRFPHQRSSHAFVDPALNNKTPSPPPRWQVEYVVAYFAEKLDHETTTVAKSVCRKMNLSEADSALETIKRRLEPFVTPVLTHATVRVNMDKIETQTLGPSSSYGISSSVNRLHFDSPWGHQVKTTAAAAPDTPGFLLPCSTVLAEPTGWGVISDIDDTIKITMTASILGTLKTTFVDEPQPVRGMPELYTRMHDLLSSPTWFYLSASPYNLYPFLRDFRRKYYPDGTLILRDASWQNLGGLMASLTLNVQEYKVNRMMKIHGWFPKRTFICIGDSTQNDPETYGEIARRFPGWVRAIFIRRTKGVSGGSDADQEAKNSEQRFSRAFWGLKSVKCFVFDEPEEVMGKIEEMLMTTMAPERIVEL